MEYQNIALIIVSVNVWCVGCVSKCPVLGACAQVLSTRGITVTITVGFVASKG